MNFNAILKENVRNLDRKEREILDDCLEIANNMKYSKEKKEKEILNKVKDIMEG